MTTTSDPAEWLRDLLREKWDLAVESLRADGVETTVSRPTIMAARDKKQAQNIDNRVVVKVFSPGEAQQAYVLQGSLVKDSSESWIIQSEMKSRVDGKASQVIYEVNRVVLRVLELHRTRPHPDWHRIIDVRPFRQDFPDYARHRVQFTLERIGEPLPTRIDQVTT